MRIVREMLAGLRRWLGRSGTKRSAGGPVPDHPASDPARRSRRLCLIVDDEQGVRHMIGFALGRLGVDAEECPSAPAVLQALRHRTPDLIFLDVSLHNSDAVEVIQGLVRQHYRGAVQLISGRDMGLVENVRHIGERHGLRMLAPLGKPFGTQAVAAVIEREGLAHKADAAPTIGLEEALRRNWLELWYQPKIDLRRNCLAGAEGLIRARHPDFGVLSPGSFLKGASPESLARLTEYVITAALRDWPDLAEAGVVLQLAVNAPASALTSVPIAALVRENRPKAVNWPGLILEVTEDEIVRDIPLAHEIATQLRIYDVTLAIDDFGAGYSSFARLKELPFAEIKLDRSYVADCASDETNGGLCQTIIDLAHRFGSLAVAEGVENAADLQALHRMGCDIAQGYLLARPMSKDRFAQLLRQRIHHQKAS